MNKVISLLSNSITRDVLSNLNKKSSNATDLQKLYHEKFGTTSNLAYQLRNLLKYGLILYDRSDNIYHITENGRLCFDLITDFITIFTEYEMDDCNSSGKITRKRRVLKA